MSRGGAQYEVVALVILAVVIVRQFQPKPVNPVRLAVVPLIFALIGLSAAGSLGHDLSGAAGRSFFAAGLAVGLVMGVVRGMTIKLEPRGAEVIAHGGPLTLALWIVTLLIRVGLGVAAARMGAREGKGEVFLFVALTLIVQNAYVIVRASRLQPNPRSA